MSNPEKYADLRHNRFTFQLYAIFILGGISLLIIASWGIYPIRNTKDGEVAARFLKNNQKLNSELGEIRHINLIVTESGGFGSKTQQLKNVDNSQSEVTKISDDSGNIRRNGEIVGANKTVEVEIYLKSQNWGDYGTIKYFTVSQAKYRDKDGDWKEVSVGWLENYFLLFK